MTHTPYNKANIFTNLLHYLLGRGLGGIAGFAFVVLLARAMEVEAYAGYTAVSGLIAFSGILTGFGLERVVARYVPEGRLERSAHELSNFIWRLAFIRVLSTLIVCLVLYVSWQYIRSLFQDIHLSAFPFVMAVFIVAESLFQYFSSVYQALVKQKVLTRILVIQWAGRLILGGVLLFHARGITLDQVFWVLAIPEVLGVTAFVALLMRYLKALQRSSSHSSQHDMAAWPNWATLSKMAMHNYGFVLLAAPPQGYFMKIMVSLFLPTSMVAAYGFFISLSERIGQYLPLNFAYNLIEPFIVGNYLETRDFESLNHKCQWLYKANLVILLPLVVWMLLAGTHISNVLVGSKFSEYYWIFALLFFQLTIGSHVVVLQLVLNTIGKSRLLLSAGIVSLCCLCIYWLGVASVHPTLILFGPMVFSLCCNAVIIKLMRRNGFAYGIPWRLYFRVLLSASLTYLGLLLVIEKLSNILHSHVVISIVSGVLIVLMYGLLMYVFRALTADDIRFIKSIKTVAKKK